MGGGGSSSGYESSRDVNITPSNNISEKDILNGYDVLPDKVQEQVNNITADNIGFNIGEAYYDENQSPYNEIKLNDKDKYADKSDYTIAHEAMHLYDKAYKDEGTNNWQMSSQKDWKQAMEKDANKGGDKYENPTIAAYRLFGMKGDRDSLYYWLSSTTNGSSKRQSEEQLANAFAMAKRDPSGFKEKYPNQFDYLKKNDLI